MIGSLRWFTSDAELSAIGCLMDTSASLVCDMSTQVTFFCGTETDILLFLVPNTETPGLWTAPVTIAATCLQTSTYEPSVYTLGVTDAEAEPVTVHPDSTVIAGATVKMNIAGLSTAVTSDATRVVPGSSVDGQLMWCAGDNITAATDCPTVPVSYFPGEKVSYVCTYAGMPSAPWILSTPWPLGLPPCSSTPCPPAPTPLAATPSVSPPRACRCVLELRFSALLRRPLQDCGWPRGSLRGRVRLHWHAVDWCDSGCVPVLRPFALYCWTVRHDQHLPGYEFVDSPDTPNVADLGQRTTDDYAVTLQDPKMP